MSNDKHIIKVPSSLERDMEEGYTEMCNALKIITIENAAIKSFLISVFIFLLFLL